MPLKDKNNSLDIKKIETATRLLLEGLGEDPDREGLRDTPGRVARAWADFYLWKPFAPSAFNESCDEMVVVRDIAFHSFCEHHLLPFRGVAHIAYIPDGRVLGLSKLVRILDQYSRCLQIQERLTGQVADAIDEHTGALGVAVVLVAEHMCMTLRGVQRPGAETVTSALRGVFRDKPDAREEVLRLCLRR